MGNFVATIDCTCPFHENCPVEDSTLMNQLCIWSEECQLNKPFGKCSCLYRQEAMDFYSGIPITNEKEKAL